MQINPGHSASAHAALTTANGRNQREMLELQTTEAKASGDIEAPQTKSDSGEPGVIGLLQSGHFKGVADVRLRIAHAERLAALQQSQTVSYITENADALAAALSSVVGDLAALNPVPAEGEDEGAIPAADPLQAFQAGVDRAAAELNNSDPADIAGFSLAVRDSFATLIEQLGLNEAASPDITADVAPAGEGTGGEEVTGNDGEGGKVAASTAPRDYLAELTTAFESALDNLLSSARESGLPSISEPAGNGKAFDKFIAIYERLQNTTDEPVVDNLGIDLDA